MGDSWRGANDAAIRTVSPNLPVAGRAIAHAGLGDGF
jgi:hypothetical protein